MNKAPDGNQVSTDLRSIRDIARTAAHKATNDYGKSRKDTDPRFHHEAIADAVALAVLQRCRHAMLVEPHEDSVLGRAYTTWIDVFIHAFDPSHPIAKKDAHHV
jgi:hypothetical protein